VIEALNDEELNMEYRIECALFLFYGNDELKTPKKVIDSLKDIQTAISEMMKIINLGEEVTEQEIKPRLMDWQHDFPQIAPAISRVLGYSVRDSQKWTHWYDFVGAYMEIGGDCTWATVISIRDKKQKHKKLEKWEEEFCREHPDLVNLPVKFTKEEEEFLSLFEQKGV
jgi:hypothetical protein